MNEVMSRPEMVAALRMNSFANSVVLRSSLAVFAPCKVSVAVDIVLFLIGVSCVRLQAGNSRVGQQVDSADLAVVYV